MKIEYFENIIFNPNQTTLNKMLTLMAAMLLFFGACSSKSYPPHDLPDQQLIFGNGGGMSGETTEYILLKNGQLFKRSSLTGETREIGRIEKGEAATFFGQANDLRVYDFNHSGNRYFFVTTKTEDGEKKLVWGNSGDATPPEEIKHFYNSLINLVQPKK